MFAIIKIEEMRCVISALLTAARSGNDHDLGHRHVRRAICGRRGRDIGAPVSASSKPADDTVGQFPKESLACIFSEVRPPNASPNQGWVTWPLERGPWSWDHRYCPMSRSSWLQGAGLPNFLIETDEHVRKAWLLPYPASGISLRPTLGFHGFGFRTSQI